MRSPQLVARSVCAFSDDARMALRVCATTPNNAVDRLAHPRIRQRSSFKPCLFDGDSDQRSVPLEGGQIRLSVVPMAAVPTPSGNARLVAATKLKLRQRQLCTLPHCGRQSVARYELEGGQQDLKPTVPNLARVQDLVVQDAFSGIHALGSISEVAPLKC